MSLVTFAKSSNNTCGICLDSLNSWIRPVVKHEGDGAKHPLHKDCLEKWAFQTPHCPSCKILLDIQSLRSLFSWKEKIGRPLKSFFTSVIVVSASMSLGRITTTAIGNLGLLDMRKRNFFTAAGNCVTSFIRDVAQKNATKESAAQYLAERAVVGMAVVSVLGSGTGVITGLAAGIIGITAGLRLSTTKQAILMAPGITILVIAGMVGILDGIDATTAIVVNTAISVIPTACLALAEKEIEWIIPDNYRVAICIASAMSLTVSALGGTVSIPTIAVLGPLGGLTFAALDELDRRGW